MRLGFVLLDNVLDVNNFKEAKELSLVSGNPSELYFRLIQLDKNCNEDQEHYLRFIPPPGAVCIAQINNLDDSLVLNNTTSPSIIPLQPYPTTDASIWKIQIPAGAVINPNSLDIQLSYSGNTYNLISVSELRQSPVGQNKFYC